MAQISFLSHCLTTVLPCKLNEEEDAVGYETADSCVLPNNGYCHQTQCMEVDLAAEFLAPGKNTNFISSKTKTKAIQKQLLSL